MLYDLTILSLLPNTLGAVMPLLPETYKNFSKTGTTLGAFSCEFGVLNRFAFLTQYDTADAPAAEPDAPRGLDQRALDQDRVGDHRIEDRVIGCVLERLGGILGHAQALARGHAGLGIEIRQLCPRWRGLEIFDHFDVRARCLQQRQGLA